jgi:Arc/MetJ-type ribon-helix-helix transcriptional regulator
VKTVTVEFPDQLHEQLQNLIKSGWVKNQQEAVTEALRRYLDSHRPELQESQILKDVQWGLQGND